MSQANIADFLRDIFRGKGSPVLFAGSGFSRRYIRTPDFSGLLGSAWVQGLKEFHYYKSTYGVEGNPNYPQVAMKMAEDFHELVWRDDAYKAFREKNSDILIDKYSAFKVWIAQMIMRINIEDSIFDNTEIEFLRKAKLDCIITTNYDCLIETIFPDYTLYIGQKDLMTNRQYHVAEIYKIHGCITKPNSIIVTENDYELYRERNKYIAAKLVTLFVERPIVFIGYSLNDGHINELITDVSKCIDDDFEKLERNLIFVKRSNGRGDSISRGFIPIKHGSIPYTIINTDDFSKVYSAFPDKNKIPADVLRSIKDNLYDIVMNNKSDSKICALGIDDASGNSEIEYVVGVGAIQSVGGTGYKMLSRADIFEDYLGEQKYDPDELLRKTFPRMVDRRRCYIPIFLYLKKAGITCNEDYVASGIELDVVKNLKFEDYISTPSLKNRFNSSGVKKFTDLEATQSPKNVVSLSCFLSPEAIKADNVAVLNFLRTNFKNPDFISSYSTYFNKLVCYYDRVMYGW